MLRIPLGQMMHTKAVELHPIPVHGAHHHQVGLDKLGPLSLSVSSKLYIATSMEYMTKNAAANFKAMPRGRAG